MHRGVAGGPAGSTLARAVSPTVASVYDAILAEILRGDRPAGSIVRDHEVADRLGVSRTPVREAMLLLRHAGVLEVSPSRYTRVAVIDEAAARRLYLVWRTLFELALTEILADGLEVDLELLEAAHQQDLAEGHDRFAHVCASGRFLDHIASCTRNPHLERAIASVAHAVRLAIISMPVMPGTPDFHRVEALLLRALRTRAPEDGEQAIAALRDLEKA